MFAAYDGRVPAEGDLVTYWFVKAGEHIGAGKEQRAGLVATPRCKWAPAHWWPATCLSLAQK